MPFHNYFTLAEVARLVRRSPTTLRVRIFRKQIQATKLGPTWLIHRHELQRKYPTAFRFPTSGLREEGRPEESISAERS